MGMKKQHRTARGLVFDMQKFSQDNEKQVALGNLGGSKPTNARGDVLGNGGKIVQKREEVVRKYYKEGLPKTEEASVTNPIKEKRQQMLNPHVDITPEKHNPEDHVFLDPQEAMEKLKKESGEQTKEFTESKPKKTTTKKKKDTDDEDKSE